MKKIFSMLLAVGMLLLTIQFVFAEENDKYDSIPAIERTDSIKEEFDQMFEFNNSKTINLDSVENRMFIEFNSQDSALRDIKVRCSNLIENIQKQYNLTELSKDNWSQYYDGLYSIIDDKGVDSNIKESDYEYRFLRAFFDIYENRFKNDMVEELAINDLSSIVTIDGLEKRANEAIAENLPYNTEFSRSYFGYKSIPEDSNLEDEENDFSTELRVAINVEPAVSYASNYAANPNTPSYYYFNSGDCANYVSQILEASGVSQDVYSSVHSGWWHKYNPNAWINKHTHSRSWTMADTFSRYMGVILTRTNHKSFSAFVHRGSILAADWSDDGDWNHTAFATASNNFIGSCGYYDYKVAQHTRNYHLWTSNPGNHWENTGIDGGRYGRIRD